MATNSYTSSRTNRHKLARRASDAANELQNAGLAAAQVASEQIEALQGMTDEYVELGRAKFRELGGEVQAHVKEKPMTALLVAAGVGFLIGAWIVRR